MSREKRRHHREIILAEAYYQDDKKQLAGGCIAKDISLSGVRIKTGEFFPVGTILDLQFKLPLSPNAFHAKGKIMWINKRPYNDEWDVGLEMLEDREYSKLVQQYMFLKNAAYKMPDDQGA